VNAPELPAWLSTVLDQFRDYVEAEHRLHDLTVSGIRNAVLVRELLDNLDASEMTLDIETETADRIKAQAEQAETEIETGFPLLHAHGVVSLWAALVASVSELVNLARDVPLPANPPGSQPDSDHEGGRDGDFPPSGQPVELAAREVDGGLHHETEDQEESSDPSLGTLPDQTL
jgi:hypothetical protein